jgi:starch phosphorylase
MAQLTPRFSANRTVREYTENYYLPAAAAYRLRSADNCATGREIVDWSRSLKQNWGMLRFGDVTVETKGGQHVYEVQVFLNGLAPETVKVELYADGKQDGSQVRQQMTCERVGADASAGTVFSAAVSAARPPEEYSVRLIPNFEGVAIPLENAGILWQR